jgi:hypothetical protein
MEGENIQPVQNPVVSTGKRKKLFFEIAAAVVILILATVLFVYQAGSFSGKASLKWNPNTESDLAGYKVYYGTSPRTGDCPKDGGYEKKVDVGNVVEYNLTGLRNNRTYYFSMTSYDKSGNESCFSAEVNKQIDKNSASEKINLALAFFGL